MHVTPWTLQTSTWGIVPSSQWEVQSQRQDFSTVEQQGHKKSRISQFSD